MIGTSIEINLQRIRREVAAAAEVSGRSAAEITLIAVSKFQNLDSMRALIGLGQRHFGENYLQEFEAKRESLKDPGLNWHFIGRIQSNKAKNLVGRFDCIHSVDRLKIAEKLNDEALKQGLRQKILIEINVGDESSKGGIRPGNAKEFIAALQDLSGLEVGGLMLMPPPEEDAEKLRPYFREARRLREELKAGSFWRKGAAARFRELSMGTSQDFRVAIEEGASLVRLGTVLFGPRPSKEMRE
jgi:pyridoxal phosphate enzyme (YggS family)